jgi:hypothetical protein
MGNISSVLSAASLTATTVRDLAVDVGFSANVAGKTYAADVTYSGSEYIADDPAVNGALATGDSVEAAEKNLTTRIDALV